MLWILLACGGDKSADDTAEPVDCAQVTNWNTVGAPFIYTWCTPCHSPTLSGEDRQGAPEGVDFGEIEDVWDYADRIEARVFAQSSPMPPAGGPTETELAELADWIACGLPE
ncbi:MAG: putative membrane protein [Myxococcota bacterium]|jgi:uncharacterized membrane protein